jgi:hypothetical protein
MPLNDAIVKRLCSIMPMLAAPSEGEVMNAVRAMNRVLKDADVHWNDVTARLATPPVANPHFRPRETPRPPPREPPPDAQPRRRKSSWMEDKDDLDKIFIRRGELDDWSEEFVESIHDQVVHQGRSLTEKQRAKLNEVMDKLGVD